MPGVPGKRCQILRSSSLLTTASSAMRPWIRDSTSALLALGLHLHEQSSCWCPGMPGRLSARQRHHTWRVVPTSRISITYVMLMPLPDWILVLTCIGPPSACTVLTHGESPVLRGADRSDPGRSARLGFAPAPPGHSRYTPPGRMVGYTIASGQGAHLIFS